MPLEVTQSAVFKIESGNIILFNTEDDKIKDTTSFNEANSAFVQLPDGTPETELPITGMEVSKLMYLKCDQAIKIKAVAPGGSVATTTEYTLTPNMASFLGFSVEKIYVKNDSGFAASLTQGYVGVNV